MSYKCKPAIQAINVAPGLSDFAAAAAGKGGDPPLMKKPIGLLAPCDEEGSGWELVGNFVVVDTSGKRRGDGGGAPPRQRSKRAQPNHTLLGGSRCSACARAGVNKCFVAQASACACCTSLRNPRGQCQAEPPAIAAPDSGSPGVVVPPVHDARGMGTR